MTTLQDMIHDEATGIDELAAHLDGLEPDARLEQTFALNRAGQRSLFKRAAASPALDFGHFVPEHIDAVQQVRHRGKNTLPLPAPLKHFEKRFSRPDDGSARLFGYNEGPTRKLVGPGFFVAIPTQGNPEWEQRGPLVVDYYQVPDEQAAIPERWPRVIPNHQGLQWFVYRHTRDFMRGVSRHVSIGAAFKGEKSLDHYFVLVRDPAVDN